MVERMFKVAFWCVQEQPEARPPIGVVVKMLEGEMDIAPPVNPFQHLMAPPLATLPWTTTTSGGDTVTAPIGFDHCLAGGSRCTVILCYLVYLRNHLD
ncbi:hypothetical protein EJB05_14599, partial [Eragrostis curvula]